VGVVGAGILAIGLFQFYRAYDAKFMEKLKPGEMNPREGRWTRRAGRLGLVAVAASSCSSSPATGA
jgi:hypothetical protein